MNPIAVLDIDGTIANCNHRLHHLKGDATDWDAFYDGMSNDLPIMPVIRLVQAIANRYQLVFITGRANRYLRPTLDWFYRQNVPWDALYMRKEGDFREDSIIKPELLQDFFVANHAGPEKVAFVLEDRPRCCRMWRERFGFTVLQLTEREF